MTIPAEALLSTTAAQVQLGGVWLFEGNWWLVVAGTRGGNTVRWGLLLTGEQAGMLRLLGPLPGLTLAPPYRWQSVVAGVSEAVVQGNVTAALYIGGDGVHIWGDFNGGHHAFNLQGQDVSATADDADRAPRFHRWKGMLIHSDHPLQPIAELFAVDRVPRTQL